MNEYSGETADLTLSLDVIYHLVEDKVYYDYMYRLFNSSNRYVIIYSSDYNGSHRFHERRRMFSSWINKNKPNFACIGIIKNKFPFDGTNGSLSDFYIYRMI